MLARDELIGLRARVTESGHQGYVGLEGRVVDETMRTLVLDTPAGLRMVPKTGQTFTFTARNGAQHTLEGRDLARRPEDRIRMARPARRGRSHAR